MLTNLISTATNVMEYAAGSVMNYFSDSHEEKKDDGDVVAPPPPAAAAIKNDDDRKDSPRRTGRKRTSTTMIIDGHVVKTVSHIMGWSLIFMELLICCLLGS